MIKADLKTFSKSIENINSTLQRIDELANTAIGQLIDLYELSKKIHVITSDDIVPLSSIFPAERLLTKEDTQLLTKAGLTPPEPGAQLIHTLPISTAPTRTRGKKATEPTLPLATEPTEPPATEPAEGEGESEEKEKGPETPSTKPDK